MLKDKPTTLYIYPESHGIDAVAQASEGRPAASGRRQGERRGSRSIGACARDGRRGQRAGVPERWGALRPGLRHKDRDGLAGDGGPGRRLPLLAGFRLSAVFEARQTSLEPLYHGRRCRRTHFWQQQVFKR
jgi:hypothetical protein